MLSSGKPENEPGGSRVLVSDRPTGVARAFCSELTARLSSAGAPWDDSIIVEEDYHPPSDSGRCFSKRFAFIIHLRSKGRVFRTERLIDGRFRKLNLLPGDLQFVPNGSETGERWDEWRQALVLAPADSLVIQTAMDLCGTGRLELRRQDGIRDLQVLHIGQALKSEVEARFPSGRLYGESLALALVVHMLASYSVSGPRRSAAGNGLSNQTLKRILAFIDENLGNDLPLSELAEYVHMNPYYFCKQFKKSVGVSPHRYVLRSRIDKGKQMLLISQLSLAEISANLGFSHQSHFSELFRRFTGMTLRQYRNTL